MDKRKKGKIGEEIAEKFLKNNGIKIIKKNYFTKFGEIDLIGIENQTIIFIEVKLRNNKNFGLPGEAVTPRKLKSIHEAAKYFLLEMGFENRDCRFDVVCLFFVGYDKIYKVDWLKGQNFD